MKPVDIKSSTYIDSSKEISCEDPKFKISDKNGIWKYKYIFPKGYAPNWSEEVLVIKTLFRGHMLLAILKEKKLLERFTRKNCEKEIKRSLELKK